MYSIPFCSISVENNLVRNEHSLITSVGRHVVQITCASI